MIEKKRLYGFAEIDQHQDTDKMPVLQNGNKVTTLQKLKTFVINALSGIGAKSDFDNLICEQNSEIGKVSKANVLASIIPTILANAESQDVNNNKLVKIVQLGSEMQFAYNDQSRNIQLELTDSFASNQEFMVEFQIGSPLIGDIMHITHTNAFEMLGSYQLYISEIGFDFFKFYLFAESGTFNKGIIFNITFAANEQV